jgi:hypothetical protein
MIVDGIEDFVRGGFAPLSPLLKLTAIFCGFVISICAA